MAEPFRVQHARCTSFRFSCTTGTCFRDPIHSEITGYVMAEVAQLGKQKVHLLLHFGCFTAGVGRAAGAALLAAAAERRGEGRSPNAEGASASLAFSVSTSRARSSPGSRRPGGKNPSSAASQHTLPSPRPSRRPGTNMMLRPAEIGRDSSGPHPSHPLKTHAPVLLSL